MAANKKNGNKQNGNENYIHIHVYFNQLNYDP